MSELTLDDLDRDGAIHDEAGARQRDVLHERGPEDTLITDRALHGAEQAVAARSSAAFVVLAQGLSSG